MFFRVKTQTWDSYHGKPKTCSYNTNHYDAYATPGTSPKWLPAIATGNRYPGACGGIQIAGVWSVLTGIHVADNQHMGGYTGSSKYRVPSPAVSPPMRTAGIPWLLRHRFESRSEYAQPQYSCL